MARRKSGKKPVPKKRLPKLETAFACPFCNHLETVVCTFDKKLKIDEASCWNCNETYSTKINFLTEAIDIYSEWLDACEDANHSIPNVRKDKKTLSRQVRYHAIDSDDE